MILDEFIINEATRSRGYEEIARKYKERMKSDIALANADELEESANELEELAKDHNQVKEWLCELKKVREAFDKIRKDAEKHKKEIDHVRQSSKMAGYYEAIFQLKEWTRQQSFSNIPKEALLIKLQEMEKGHG